MGNQTIDDNTVEDSSSSTGVENEVSTDANNEEGSSTSQTQAPEKPQTLADVVKATFAKSVPAPDKKQEAEEVEEETEEEGDEPETPVEKPETEEESDSDPANKSQTQNDEKTKGPVPYKRFEEVNRAKVTAEQTIEQQKPLVDDYNQIVNYLQSNNVPFEKFGFWLRVAAAAENDPEEANKLLEPFIKGYQAGSGDVLDEDLQEALDKGEINAHWAKQTQQSRSQVKSKQHKADASAKQNEQIRARQAQQQMVSALSNWQSTKQQSDPDFTQKPGEMGKFEVFINKFQASASAQPFTSVADAVQRSEQIYAEVNKLFKTLTPKPKQSGVAKPKSTTSAAVDTNKQQPKTLREAVNVVARKHGYAV